MTSHELFALFRNGIEIVIQHAGTLSIFLAAIFVPGLLGSINLKNKTIDFLLAFAISAGIGTLTIASFILVWITQNRERSLPLVSNSFILVLGTVGLLATLQFFARCRSVTAPVGFLFLLVALPLFGFIDDLEFPLYHDSAAHYQIISDLQNPDRPAQTAYKFQNIPSNKYYHFGFHALTAVISNRPGQADHISQGILIIGQLFLVLFAVNLGLLAVKLTGSGHSGLYTMVFAGLGWTMPEYAINWGKYPALASLTVLPLAVYWLLHFLETRTVRSLVGFGLIVLCVGLFHSRSIIYMGGIALALAINSLAFKRLSTNIIFFLLLCMSSVVWIPALLYNSNMKEAVAFYFQGGDVGLSVATIIITVISSRRYPLLTAGVVFFLSFLVAVSSIETPAFPLAQSGQYLLDRTFLQISLVMPISLLAGMGFSTLANGLKPKMGPLDQKWVHPAALLLIAMLLFTTRPFSSYKPDACCEYMEPDDIFMINLIRDELPANSRILISSEINEAGIKTPTDGGAWITPITGFESVKLHIRTDFSKPVVHKHLCRENIQYIYVSLANPSFNALTIENNTQYYERIAALPETFLYGIRCP